MPDSPTENKARYALAVFRVMFGGSRKWTTGIVIIGIWISINWFSSAIYEILQNRFHLGQLSGLALFVLVPWLYRDVKRAAALLGPAHIVSKQPEPRQGLVLFLSPPKDKSVIDAVQGDITHKSVRDAFGTKSPWHMPIEAIAHHVNRLKTVVVLPSSDPGPQRPASPGTWREFDYFKKTLVRLAAAHQGFQIIPLWDISSEWNAGVDFENPTALLKALQQVFLWLHAQGIPDHEIMVDVTGGSKVASVAGAAVTIGAARQFEYVSTQDYQVLSFDFKYEEDYG